MDIYLNWLLKSHSCKLFPVVTPAPDLALSEVNTISFKPYSPIKREPQSASSPTEAGTQKKWLKLADEIFEKLPELLFKNAESLPKIEWKNVIAAELILKIKNLNKLNDEDFQKVFGTLLKPVADTDQVTFKNKKGEDISGSEIIKTKQVDIEIINKNMLVEPNLHQEMAKFLDELASVQVK